MNKITITTFLVATLVMITVILVVMSPEEETFKTPGNWVKIEGTADIYYDKNSLARIGSMVYVSLNNRNPQALKSLEASELLFAAALYCNRDRVRTLSKTIHYTNGSIEHDEANNLEDNPETDKLNETPDLIDITATPDLTLVYSKFCQ